MADLGSGFFNFDWEGDDSQVTAGSTDVVLPEVAWGGPAEQPSTPAGNGFGEYLFGTIDKALNWALQKDQFKFQAEMQAKAQRPPVAVQPTPVYSQPAGGGVSQTLLLVGGAAALLAVVLMVRR